jgi:hypothetical protein
MSLDVYVMPIWKFKAGDFTSPLEALGAAPVVVSPGGITQREPGTPASFITRWKAKRATRRLRREIEAEVGHAVEWNEDGYVAYSEQGQPFEILRAYAKWLDYRDLLPTFDPPPEDDYHKHPVMTDNLARPLTYPQLVAHSCYSGYFIPTDLERVVYVERYTIWDTWRFKRSVGSSLRLLADLEQLGQVLEVDEHYQWTQGDPLAPVKAAFAQLFEIAKISRKMNLPIVFHG